MIYSIFDKSTGEVIFRMHCSPAQAALQESDEQGVVPGEHHGHLDLSNLPTEPSDDE
jgi:hypothetical protein